MKKILSTLLVVVIVLSLCACGKAPEIVNVETLIDRIGTVTIESGEAISKAEKAYEELYAQYQEDVSNIDKLIQAREEFDLLVAYYPVDCFQIDTITTYSPYSGDTTIYKISYVYGLDGLIEQYTISHTFNSDGKTYRYEDEHHLTYDENGQVIKHYSTNRALDENITQEVDLTERYSPDGLLTSLGDILYTYKFDELGFVATCSYNDHVRTNSYDLSRGIGTFNIENEPSAYTVDYTFSIVQVPNCNRQTVINIMTSLLMSR